MNGRERVLRAVSFQPTDRVPRDLGGMASFVIVPLLVRRVVLGLVVGDTSNLPEGLDGVQSRRLLNYANQGAVNLENALIGSRLQRQSQALERANWVQKDAARLLGVSSRALNYKIKNFRITHPRWKQNR